jgi:acyl-[acyl-carrier-protein]-phospholipid O-acyltransferase / long-chain-fatty-acid--[acyl-carrier-protein] ligase
MPKFISSFAALNSTQFLTALNDNLYKLLLVFFLISLKGEEHSNTILSLAGAIFVIPFLIFASLSGTLADRFSKRSIIYVTRLTEILTTTLGLIAFAFHSAIGAYAVLFLMAVQSTLFSPCKYGIIPEIVPKTKISHYNGMITGTTYLAIIIGTFLASFITEATQKNFVLSVGFCVLIATLGLITSLGIEKTLPQASQKKFSARFISVVIKTLLNAKKKRYLVTSIVFGAYFLFMGSYTQLNIIPFAFQSLHLSEVYGGYLFLLTAIGIGIGSYLAGYLSGKEVELGFVPLAALGVTICFLCLYFFNHHFYVVVPFLILVGVFGGFYTIPIDSFIQLASPDEDRGQNLATSNFMSFVGVLLASGLLALLGNGFGLSAAQGFLVMGILTGVMSLTLFLIFADQLFRLIVAATTRFLLEIRIRGRSRLQLAQPTLLVAPRTTWLDTILVMAALPRLIRYIVPIEDKQQARSVFYRWLRLIPLDSKHFNPIDSITLKTVRSELDTGNSVCLMLPNHNEQTLQEWESKLRILLKETQVPILPLHISKLTTNPTQSLVTQFLNLRHSPIRISLGAPQ